MAAHFSFGLPEEQILPNPSNESPLFLVPNIARHQTRPNLLSLLELPQLHMPRSKLGYHGHRQFEVAAQNNFYHPQMHEMQYLVGGRKQLQNFIPALLAGFHYEVPNGAPRIPRMAALQSKKDGGSPSMIQIAVELKHPETTFEIYRLVGRENFFALAKTCDDRTVMNMSEQIYKHYVQGKSFADHFFNFVKERAPNLKMPLEKLNFIMNYDTIRRAGLIPPPVSVPRARGPQLVQSVQ